MRLDARLRSHLHGRAGNAHTSWPAWLQLFLQEGWRQLLSGLAAVLLLYALVAERRAVGTAAKAWWRQLRAALKDLLSLGLTLSPRR